VRLRFLIREQLLRGLPHLLQEPALIARLIDSRLQLVAELRQTFEPLLIGQAVIQRVLERHGVSCERPPRHQKWERYSIELTQTPYPRGTRRSMQSIAVNSRERLSFQMHETRMKRTTASALIAALLVCGLFAAEPVSRRDAARLQAKLDRIMKGTPSLTKTPATVAITETEVNSYLQYELSDRIPAGVTDPWVTILDNGRIGGRATVDLARVGQSRKSGGMLDPFNYLTGSLPLEVNGVLTTKNGVANFAVESASISSVPVPIWMLQEIVSYYSKSASAPAGVAIDKPFVLPGGIREIRTARGQATVVQ